VNRWAKEEILGKVMDKNRLKDYLDTKKLGFVTPKQAVYINEHLSPGLQEVYHVGRKANERGEDQQYLHPTWKSADQDPAPG